MRDGLFYCTQCKSDLPDERFDFDDMEDEAGQILCKSHMAYVNMRKKEIAKARPRGNKWTKFGAHMPRKKARIDVEIKYRYKSGDSLHIRNATHNKNENYVVNDVQKQWVEPWDIWRYA